VRSNKKVKAEKRALKKRKRRYPVSGRGVFLIQQLKKKA